jgi:hypothetical protein
MKSIINKFLRWLLNFLKVIGAALAGNWIGAQLHTRITGEHASGVVYRYTDEQGLTYQNIPVSSNFTPAVLLSFLGKPGWVFAFLGGLLMSLVFGDRLEKPLMTWIIKTVVSNTERLQAARMEADGGSEGPTLGSAV